MMSPVARPDAIPSNANCGIESIDAKDLRKLSIEYFFEVELGTMSILDLTGS